MTPVLAWKAKRFFRLMISLLPACRTLLNRPPTMMRSPTWAMA
jgi:hypothetical protein